MDLVHTHRTAREESLAIILEGRDSMGFETT